MTYLEQNEASGRQIFPDLVRAFALFGIVMVNVAYFAWPGMITYFYGGLNSPLDEAAMLTVDAVFLFKSYTLFSFMFGAGLAYQMMSAERRGVAFAPRYFRRMLGLLILGILHVSFAFVGDILIPYAVLGCLLFLFRNRPLKSLLRWGGFFLGLQLVISFGLFAITLMGETYAAQDMAIAAQEMQLSMDEEFVAYSNSGFWETVQRRWTDWTMFILFAGMIQFPGVISFFIFGLAAVRSKVLEDPSAKLWSRSRALFFPVGIALSGLGAALLMRAGGPMESDGMLASSIIMLGAPLASMGYMGWIAKWSDRPPTRLMIFLARAGTSTLSAYLLQSLILSILFSAYGLGLYGKVGAAGCVSIALLTGLFTLSASSLWRKTFERGPIEMLLRRWTYLGAR